MKWITFGDQPPTEPTVNIGSILPAGYPTGEQKPISPWVVAGIAAAGIGAVYLLTHAMETSAERASKIR